MLVIDDTAVPKKGKHSVGVAWQYASALGKNANCQTLVSLTLARDEVPVMVALRLFLPESWTSDLARLKRAGVPVEYRTARTKPEIALAEIDRVIATGVRFACVLADAGYGLSAPFRHGLTARHLAWAVGIPRHLKVYPDDVRLLWPVARRGRPDAAPGPADEAVIDRRRRAILGRAVAPAATAFQDVHNAADDAAIIGSFDPAYVRRQVRFDALPLLIAQPK